MIPNPPLNEDGELAASRWTLLANLVGGILSTCCTCRVASATHWEHEGRYIPLHERCVDHLIQEWRTMIAHEEASLPAPVERPMGAYARRAAARVVGPERPPVAYRAVSVSLGSPFFIPGMEEGAPWVAVANMPDGIPRISPAGANGEAHVRKVNSLWQAAAVRGYTLTFDGVLPLGGYVCDPTGARLEEWRTDELASRVDSAKIAG